MRADLGNKRPFLHFYLERGGGPQNTLYPLHRERWSRSRREEESEIKPVTFSTWQSLQRQTCRRKGTRVYFLRREGDRNIKKKRHCCKGQRDLQAQMAK